MSARRRGRSVKSPPGGASAVDDVSDRPKKSRAKWVGSNASKKSKRTTKSPASRHTAVRRWFQTEQVPVSEGDDESEEDQEDKDKMEIDDEGLRIQRIIAAASTERKEWKKFCSKINTTEIVSGSRWYQNDVADGDSKEERFLIKWEDLSYLHCSWETQADLVQKLGNAKKYLSTFLRKRTTELHFCARDPDDRDYFDPSFTQVERILEVELPDKGDSNNNYGIIMKKSHRNFDSGTGRQFLIKWKGLQYTDCTYEFERDLITKEVAYEDQIHDFYKRSKKPPKSEVESQCADGEIEFRKLYGVFGGISKMDDEKLNDAVVAYQKDLANVVYPNGMQLKDYHVYGVSWMMTNYINGRSSLLADEMGLGSIAQSCAFIEILANKLNRRGPFLFVVPQFTLEGWKQDINKWTGLNAIVYDGSAKNREHVRELEFTYEEDRVPRDDVAVVSSLLKDCNLKSDKLWMVQVVVTSHELMCTDDFVELTAHEWDAIVVDEAHCLKNHSSKLATNLRDPRFVFQHTLLLAGNRIDNLTDLWSYLYVLDPNKFSDLSSFIETYGNKGIQWVDELHDDIRPYILSRMMRTFPRWYR